MSVASGSFEHQQLVDTAELELSILVGRPVWIYSEQFPGEPIGTRVSHAEGGVMAVDRWGNEGQLDNLVHNQKVTVQFDYKGEKVSIPAAMKRTSGGRLSLILDRQAIALTRRRFQRIDAVWPARLAVLPIASFRADKIGSLRWLQTDTINFSSGGVLVELSSYLMPDTVLLVNFDQENFDFPALIAGCVRHCRELTPGRFLAGIEFIINEKRLQHLPPATVQALPRIVFEYDQQRRTRLNQRVRASLNTND